VDFYPAPFLFELVYFYCMKQPKILTIALSVVVLITACKLYYTPQRVTHTVTANATQVQEGKRLTMMMCVGCHINGETKQLTGKRMHDVPGIVGKVYSKNITQDVDKGIGDYTDGELVYLIRTGIAKDGRLMPYMQRPNLATKDMDAIIAFLHSNDPMVRPAGVSTPNTKYTPMGKFGISKFSKPLPYSDTTIKRPTEKTAYGRYLVDNLGCFHCHSAGFTKLNMLEPERSKGYMGGGQKMKNESGEKISVPNLTFHETGIGNWTESDLVRALKEGFNKNNEVLRPPMPMFPELSDDEIGAIYAYLKTVSPIDNKVARTTNPGANMYVKYACNSCHGANGKGIGDLRQANSKFTDEQLVSYISNPRSFDNEKMPVYKGVIKQEDYAPLIAYIKKLGTIPSNHK
jgi:mono/diheme cytochrome c family protein